MLLRNKVSTRGTLTGLLKNHLALYSLEYKSGLIAGRYIVRGDRGNNQVYTPPGLGQHPITPVREVPAGIDLHIFG